MTGKGCRDSNISENEAYFGIDDILLSIKSMSLNLSNSDVGGENDVFVEIEPGFEAFVPDVFRQGPVEYFECVGKDIKRKDIGQREVPANDAVLVKELPSWEDKNGKTVCAIAKRIDPNRAECGPSKDPFHEYEIIKAVNCIGIPAPKPIAKAKQKGFCLILTEKIPGISWYDKDAFHLKEHGYTDAEIFGLYQQAEKMMYELKDRCDKAGVIREWKMQDMVFDIDIDKRMIHGMVPTDWRWTEIDEKKWKDCVEGMGK